jgi:hypothetical protein
MTDKERAQEITAIRQEVGAMEALIDRLQDCLDELIAIEEAEASLVVAA